MLALTQLHRLTLRGPTPVRQHAAAAAIAWFSEAATNQEHLSAFEQTVGNTRLVRLSHASRLTGCDIFGKAEYENPGGSIKVRSRLQTILSAVPPHHTCVGILAARSR